MPSDCACCCSLFDCLCKLVVVFVCISVAADFAVATFLCVCTGVGALVFGVFRKANSDVTAAEVKDIIKVTVQPLEAAKQTTQWGGAVDVAAAVLVSCSLHMGVGSLVRQLTCTSAHTWMPMQVFIRQVYLFVCIHRHYGQCAS